MKESDYFHGHEETFDAGTIRRGKPNSIKSKNKARFVHCNLCGKEFKTKSRFERFCNICKVENEEYQSYSEYDSPY